MSWGKTEEQLCFAVSFVDISSLLPLPGGMEAGPGRCKAFLKYFEAGWPAFGIDLCHAGPIIGAVGSGEMAEEKTRYIHPSQIRGIVVGARFCLNEIPELSFLEAGGDRIQVLEKYSMSVLSRVGGGVRRRPRVLWRVAESGVFATVTSLAHHLLK